MPKDDFLRARVNTKTTLMEPPRYRSELVHFVALAARYLLNLEVARPTTPHKLLVANPAGAPVQ